MEITIIQSSDPFVYYDMLSVTARTVRAFCANSDVKYESYVGLKRGTRNWHSTYNRIPMLRDLLDSGHNGWVLWMDADAYVEDIYYPLADYLSDKGKYSILAAPSGTTDAFWDVNIGVVFFNMAHPFTRRLILAWCDRLARYDLAREAIGWSVEIPDDQAMFMGILQDTPGSEDAVLQVRGIINWPEAAFVRQIMRAYDAGNFETRIALVKREVDRIMGDSVP